MYTGSDSIAGVANKGFTATISSYTVLSIVLSCAVDEHTMAGQRPDSEFVTHIVSVS